MDDDLAHELLSREVRDAASVYFATNWVAIAWLVTFCVSGVAAAMAFNVLHLHAGPAKGETFFLAFLGYWAQLLAGGVGMLLVRSFRLGSWSRGMVGALVASSVLSGASEGLDTLGKMQAGMGVFTIAHASVALFACVFAVVVLKASVPPACWLGAALVVGGVGAARFPSSEADFRITGSTSWGIVLSVLGTLGNAASYAVLELVFVWAREKPSEEQACFFGSFVNVLAFSAWTLAFTAPRWHQSVVEPIDGAPSPDYSWACGGYVLWTAALGVHSLSFIKCISKLGTVPTAISIGAQQAGNLVVAHILFCHADDSQCFWSEASGTTSWDRSRKTVGFSLCCVGCLVYMLGRSWSSTPQKRKDLTTAQAPLPHAP